MGCRLKQVRKLAKRENFENMWKYVEIIRDFVGINIEVQKAPPYGWVSLYPFAKTHPPKYSGEKKIEIKINFDFPAKEVSFYEWYHPKGFLNPEESRFFVRNIYHCDQFAIKKMAARRTGRLLLYYFYTKNENPYFQITQIDLWDVFTQRMKLLAETPEESEALKAFDKDCIPLQKL